MNIFRYIVEGYKAWMRDEIRVQHRKARGRVFEKKKEKASTGAVTKAKAEYQLTGIRVIRADGTVEEKEF